MLYTDVRGKLNDKINILKCDVTEYYKQIWLCRIYN